MSYEPPLLGTFYVPPGYANLVSKLPPVAGDFAAGARKVGVRVHYLETLKS